MGTFSDSVRLFQIIKPFCFSWEVGVYFIFREKMYQSLNRSSGGRFKPLNRRMCFPTL